MYYYYLVFIAAFIVNQAFSIEWPPKIEAPKLLSFSFSSFNDKSCKIEEKVEQLFCLGSATVTKQGSMDLTKPNGYYGVGSVLYYTPVMDWKHWPGYFNTSFTFTITNKNRHCWSGSCSDDGMTFLLASETQNNSFDFTELYNREKETENLQLFEVAMVPHKDGDQIAIITNRLKKPIITKSLNSTGVELASGKKITVEIEYNALTTWLQISVGYASNSLVKFLSRQIDIKAIVPHAPFVGFSATGGNSTASHELHRWDFKANQ